jgi:hypothetical protein
MPTKDEQHQEPTSTHGSDVSRMFQETLDRVVSMRNPWAWMFNSCHLDTWLMVELAFFGKLATSWVTPLTDDMVQSSPPLTKLFKVLFAAGSENQDKMKMGYWAMEIEEYMQGTRKARGGFKQFSTYQSPAQLLHTRSRSDPSVDLVSTYVGMEPICSNPDHIDQIGIRKRVCSINAEDAWYSMPDDWTRTKDSTGRWTTNQCHQFKHRSFSDVVETLLGRSDGETKNCGICATNHPGTAFQEHQQRLPQFAKLPLSLEFNVDAGTEIEADLHLEIGGLHYTLLAVVFGDGAHFKCNVCLRGLWYHYDDLGMEVKQQQKKSVPNTHRMVRVKSPAGYMTPPAPWETFKPIAYRYIRDEMTTAEPMELPRWMSLPTGLQFNSMWRLLVEGYDN